MNCDQLFQLILVCTAFFTRTHLTASCQTNSELFLVVCRYFSSRLSV